MSSTVETVSETSEIRPFHVEIPEEGLVELRRRTAAARWPSKELVEDRSQGVQLATLQALARYWTTDYDFGRIAARLNALPQFTTEIDGVEIHFIHVQSQHEDAMPLIMTHGWHDAVKTFTTDGFGYFLEQATRPQTIGYSLLDSPVALAAWLLDHDTDSYYKISGAFVDGEPVGNLTRDTIVDNITLYWLTGTAASAARSYWEDARALAAALASGQAPPEVSVPVGFTTFPGEIWRTPRSWVQNSYPNLTYFNEVDKGGHFAAWEEPELFAEEMRAAFTSLR